MHSWLMYKISRFSCKNLQGMCRKCRLMCMIPKFLCKTTQAMRRNSRFLHMNPGLIQMNCRLVRITGQCMQRAEAMIA